MCGPLKRPGSNFQLEGLKIERNRPILELSFYDTEFHMQSPLMPTLHQTHLQYNYSVYTWASLSNALLQVSTTASPNLCSNTPDL